MEYSWFFTLFLASPAVNNKLAQRILYLLDPIGLNYPFLLSKKHMHTNFYYLGIRDWVMSTIGLLFGTMTIGLLALVSMILKFLGSNFLQQKLQNGNAEAKESVHVVEPKVYGKGRLMASVFFIAFDIFLHTIPNGFYYYTGDSNNYLY